MKIKKNVSFTISMTQSAALCFPFNHSPFDHVSKAFVFAVYFGMN